MQSMSSVKLPLDMPSMENTSHESTNLPQRINIFVENEKRKEDMNGNLLGWL